VLELSKRDLLQRCHITDEETNLYVEAGMLRLDNGSWTPAVPGLSSFTKSFNMGRKALLTIVKRSKNQEILQEDLELSKLPRVARLGAQYHVHDVIGAGLVQRVETSTGQQMLILTSSHSVLSSSTTTTTTTTTTTQSTADSATV